MKASDRITSKIRRMEKMPDQAKALAAFNQFIQDCTDGKYAGHKYTGHVCEFPHVLVPWEKRLIALRNKLTRT